MQEEKNQNKFSFVQPTKKIVTEEDLEKFKKTQVFNDILSFILELQKSVEAINIEQGKQNTNNQKLKIILEFYKSLETLLEEIPPIQQQMRFGNRAFKTFLDRLWAEKTDNFILSLLSDDKKEALIEVKVYLNDSFGSHQRIDYGTGHELNFFLFLMCLKQLAVFDSSDYEFVVHKIFHGYIQLMRKIQLQYLLEPAGSHGVWGLDDYQFLPFLFGAAELVNQQSAHPTPDKIPQADVAVKYKDTYMLFSAVNFINTVKKGPFHEHSPILYNMSGVQQWTKVAIGLVKMYSAEVLLKHPVIKHTFFGSLIAFQ